MKRQSSTADVGREGTRRPNSARERTGGDAGRDDRVAALHEAVGNAGVEELLEDGDVQPRLEVSQPGDPAEQEAERVAATLVGDSDDARVGSTPSVATDPRPATGTGRAVDEPTQAALRAGLTGGRPLPATVRSRFEAGLGRDLSAVRVHTGGRADAAARSIDAEAFTVGRDIAFARGNYRPETATGRRLLAHELTHVLQQRSGQPRVQRSDPERNLGGDEISNEQVLSRAIHLFGESEASTDRVGRQVHAELQRLDAAGEIVMTRIEGGRTGGVTYDGWKPWNPTIAVDERMRNNSPDDNDDVVAVALTLVHEGVHRVMTDLYVDEELAARRTTVAFAEELLDGIQAHARQYTLDLADYPDIQDMRAAIANDRLVDWVFEDYHHKPDFYTAAWVRAHLDDWGGLDNRELFTKAMFLRKLVRGAGRNEESIRRILESGPDRNTLVMEAGISHRELRNALPPDRDDSRGDWDPDERRYNKPAGLW